MFELLLAFAFWPWFLFIALILAFTVSAAFEMTSIAAVAAIIYGAVVSLAFGVNPIAWVISDPLSVALIAVLYIAVGVAWSLFKWREHLTSESLQKKIKEGRERYKLNDGTDASEFRSSSYFPAEAGPEANKTRIINWIALWPFSAFMFVFYDLLSRFFNRLYDAISGIYEKFTNRYTQ